MQPEQQLHFGSYRLDLRTGQVWRGKQEVKLPPKALAVLRILVTRSGQVVTKDELFQAVWPGTVVSDAALTSCIQELRQALRDDAKKPRYIETVHRRGFRFIAPLIPSQPVSSSKFQVSGQHSVGTRQLSGVSHQQLETRNLKPETSLVGRELELAQLHICFAKALNGERQIIFVTGEPGIGKTTVVEAFLSQLETRDWGLGASPWIGRGQCIEHYGAGEAYLPLLEALGRLGRESGGQRLIELLSQQAPTWLVQMPALLTTTELEMLQRKTAGATRERMLRELAEAVERLTAERPLVLWLEDLHWCDVSTLDWLACVARRQEPARLLVIGTYRPVDVLVREHSLRAMKQELQTHGYCAELLLDFLSEEAVAEYLAVRFSVPSPLVGGACPEPSRRSQDGGALRQEHDRRPPHPGPLPRGERGAAPPTAALRRLAPVIHHRTDGNPLFMVNVVDYLVAQGMLVHSDGRWELQGSIEERIGGVPESLQQLIEQHIARLMPETQRLLEVASVAGTEFSAAAVAAGMETEVDAVEEQCEELVRQEHFLRASGTAEWPDRTVAARYGFLHALYQDVLYNRLTARRRQRFHKRIGEREEAAYGERAGEIAAELALHFERGCEYARAIQYLQRAGENALRRSAYQEAISLLTKGLGLLTTLSDTPERLQQELALQMTLGQALMAARGFAAAEVGHAYSRARELCQQLGKIPQLLRALANLFTFHLNRAEIRTAREEAEQFLTLAQSTQDPAQLEGAHQLLGNVLFRLGELVPAREHLEQGFALYASPQRRFQPSLLADRGMGYLLQTSFALWALGYPDQALQKSHEGLALARERSHPFDLAYALGFAARVHQLRRDGQAGQQQAEEAIALSTEHEFPYWLATGTKVKGWALAAQGQIGEGIAEMRQGLATHWAMGAELNRSWDLALLAEAYGEGGQAGEGLSVLAEALALVDKTGDCWYEAELHRLKGTLTLQSKVSSPKSQVEREAEECFQKAIEIARKQQAKSLELRAAVSLSRLWQQQGKTAEARQRLAEIYGWFTEGFDTKDLQEAKALLEELN